MKRHSLLGLLAALALSFVPFLIVTPAEAAVTTCTKIVIVGSGYPSEDGHLYNCMQKPHNMQETSMQVSIMNTVIAHAHHFAVADRNDLANAHVDIKVFYNGTDALDILKIASEPGPKPTETGRSWASILGQPNLTVPTSSIWVYTFNQWNALHGAIPQTYDPTQLGGTTHHELGHQLDVVWAKLRTPPLDTSITTNDAKWNRAINLDAQHVSASNRNFALSNWPQLFVQGTSNWSPSEVFPEELARVVGGGVLAAEGEWLQAHMTCSYWYVLTLEANNGATPAQLQPSACYEQTN